MPSRYKTRLCSFGVGCNRPICFFAHNAEELRFVSNDECGEAETSAMMASLQPFGSLDMHGGSGPLMQMMGGQPTMMSAPLQTLHPSIYTTAAMSASTHLQHPPQHHQIHPHQQQIQQQQALQQQQQHLRRAAAVARPTVTVPPNSISGASDPLPSSALARPNGEPGSPLNASWLGDLHDSLSKMGLPVDTSSWSGGAPQGPGQPHSAGAHSRLSDPGLIGLKGSPQRSNSNSSQQQAPSGGAGSNSGGSSRHNSGGASAPLAGGGRDDLAGLQELINRSLAAASGSVSRSDSGLHAPASSAGPLPQLPAGVAVAATEPGGPEGGGSDDSLGLLVHRLRDQGIIDSKEHLVASLSNILARLLTPDQ